MPSSINYPPDAKGKWSLPVLIALIAFAAVSFLVHVPRRVSRDELVAKMHSLLREENFERLYDEANENLRLNVTKERFVRRMKLTAAKLKAIDAGLNFKRDAALERSFPTDESRTVLAMERLKGDGKSVLVYLNWDGDGKFYDLAVFPESDTSQEYAVIGVHGQYYTAGNKRLDW